MASVKVESHPRFLGVYWVEFKDGSRRLATKNSVLGKRVYGELLIKHGGVEYRVWDPYRSKLAGAIIKSLENMPIRPGHKVLYLGAASGTTASHVSDIIGEKGHVFCVEFAARSIRELVSNVCAFRQNMSPILADARFPEQYSVLVEEVDDIYCDVAQPEQAKILADNANTFLKSGGWIMLAIKSQSIDVTKDPSEIFKQEIRVLEDRGFQTREVIFLEPYDKAHAMVTADFIK